MGNHGALCLGVYLGGNLVFHKPVHNLSIQIFKGIVGRGEQGEVSRLTQLLNQTGFSSHSLEKKWSILQLLVNWFGS